MTGGESTHKEPLVTTDEFMARNGTESTKNTEDDIQVIRASE